MAGDLEEGMNTSRLVVTGATGQIGGALTQQLLSRGHTVRAVARRPEALQALAAKGAEVHAGSVGDEAFLTRVLTGADGAFLLVPPDYHGAGMLERQRRVVDAEVAAVKASGIKRIVALSSIGAERPSGTGPIVTLHYFEEKLRTLEGVDVLMLRATYFMENFLQNIDLIRNMGINGTAARPDTSLAMVATRDIAMAAAEALEKGEFSGHVVGYVLGPRDVTFGEVSRILGKAIGRPDLPYVQFSYEATEKALLDAGLPADIAAAFVEMYRAANEGLLAPTQPRSSENTTPTTIEAWSRVFATAYKGTAKAASA